MKKMLMLGTSLMSKEIVIYAKSIGVYTIVTDYLPPEKSRAKLFADEYWMINTKDIDELENKCRREGVTAVICGVSEFNLEVCMELCNRLGLPSYCTPAAWHFSRDKSDFKLLCKELDAPIPDDYYITDQLSQDELKKVKYPVVVKPVDMSSNRGITYCYNEDELINAYRYARSVSHNPKIIVERMLRGREWYGFYVLADGEMRQVALNAMEAEPGELKNLYSLTTTVTDHVEQYMKEIDPKVKEVLKKVGCEEGIAWVQVMLDEDGHFYIIEMGYRLPGDCPNMTYPETIGFDTIKWMTDYALGKKHTVDMLPNEQNHSFKKCGTAYSLWTKCSGKITSINGIDTILKEKGIGFYSLYQVGDSFDKHSPVGVFSINTDTIDELCEKIDYINKTVSIINEDGEDIIIKYTDFDYLHEMYISGLSGK